MSENDSTQNVKVQEQESVAAEVTSPPPQAPAPDAVSAPKPKDKAAACVIADEQLNVSSSPHLNDQAMTTRRVMLDVVISLLPLVAASVIFFQFYAVKQIVISVISCLIAEYVFTLMRKKPNSLGDLSAIITGLILALSMPGTAPWYVTVAASFAAIGIGKAVFGGLGMNIFNPAMVGRAFVMIAFAGAMAATGYVDLNSQIDIVSQATPLTAFKQNAESINVMALFWGNSNGSLGETSALACIIGGVYLLIRKIITWEIPAGVIGAVIVIALLNSLLSHGPVISVNTWSVIHHVCAGAVLFGAFFIATDPVTSPITVKGKLIFGIGVGFFIMVLRLFSGYPEGVMFAVLIMNGLTPLINRWTIPKPFGGLLQQEKKGA